MYGANISRLPLITFSGIDEVNGEDDDDVARVHTHMRMSARMSKRAELSCIWGLLSSYRYITVSILDLGCGLPASDILLLYVRSLVKVIVSLV